MPLPDPAVEQAPVPATAPVAEPKPAEAPTTPPLARETAITFNDKNGNPVTKTIGEMADSYKGQPSVEEMNQLNLYKKAIHDKDPQAAKDLIDMFQPSAEPVTSAPTSADEVKSLNDRIQKMESQLNEGVSPVIGRIMEQANAHRITLQIEAGKKDFPLLSKVTNAPSMVIGRRKHYEGLAREKNYDLSKAPDEILQKVDLQAMKDVEAYLVDLQKQLGGSLPASPGIVSVNDQSSPDPSGNYKAPRYQRNKDGAFVDVSPIPQAQPPLSALPVTPTPIGTPAGLQPDTAPAGPLTPQTMQQQMAERNRQLGGLA